MLAKVENGVVVSVMSGVPASTENVSGFNFLSVADRITHGYYPLVNVKDVFDPAIEKLLAMPVYTIGATEVTATYRKIALTPDELAAIEAAKPTLAQTKTKQLSAMEAAFSTENQKPISYLTFSFHADDTSTDLMGTVLATLTAAGGTTGIDWWDASNTARTLTYVQFAGLCIAVLTRGQVLFANKQTKRVLIQAASTKAEVESVVW